MLSNGVTNIDSVTKYTDYINKAVECDMKALAFSEHGSFFEYLHKKEACEKAGLKYIHAAEFYVTKSLEEKVRDNYHCLLIAKNYEGFKELNKLSSVSFNREDGHFYFAPRITFDELINTSDNVIVSSACLGGIFASDDPELKFAFLQFYVANRDRCFLEIAQHPSPQQVEYNKVLYDLSKKYNLQLVVGTDTHALNEEHADARLLLQRSKKVFFDNEGEFDMVWRTYDELVQMFDKQGVIPREVVRQALENTNKIADMVEPFELDRGFKYPQLYQDSDKVLLEKINDGWKWRNIDSKPNQQKYKEEIEYELKAIRHNKSQDFFLLEEMYKSELRKKGVGYGYSRGSASGSLICYLLGITHVDPIEWHLNFDRFMNVERVSLADIDTDWFDTDRDKVRDLLYAKQGLYCSEIITFNTVALKGAFKDVARAFDMTPQEANEITSDIEVNEEKYRKQYPEIFRYVDLIQGTIVSIGTHPSACIVSPISLDDNVGLCSVANNSRPVSQLNMKEIDSLNYVKLDCLGLDAVGLINQTCDLLGIDRLLPENIDFNDKKVWDSIREDTTCIFQWESDSARSYLKELFSDETVEKIKKLNPNFSYLDLMSVGNGAIRPAGASYRNELAQGIYRDNGHKALNKLLAPTLGYLVYQCQIINFLHQFCGYTMGEADVVRRCVDENTLITMATGKRKKIKDVQEGEEVVTVDDNGFVKYNKVNRVYANGKKETIVIKTNQNHAIKVTPNHKCLTVSGWKEASELSVGDCLMVPKKYSIIDDGLTPQQRLKCSDMFLIGMLLGDGCIGGNEWDIHFTNSDLTLINKFKECVAKRTKNHNEPEFGITEQDGVTVDKVYSIRIKSKNYRDSVMNLLKKFELNKASQQKHLPVELMSYPVNDKLLSLLGGLFSTDGGYVSQVNCFEYYTISEELAYDIHFLLGKCDICSYVYRSYVNGYNYYCYKVRIYQKDAVVKFGKLILPYMVGNKVEKFAEIINNKITKDSATQPYYNYSLPRDCVDEIIHSSINSKRSLNSIGITSGISQNGSITDVKAKRILMKLYYPMTYKLITSDYMPVKIKSIEYGNMTNVYDLEIDENHNYLADGLIVHNCFAKKLGTEQHIPQIKEGFIKTMFEKYDVDKQESERLIANFIQVIEDASSYLFSENHALPYSMIGYAVGWLRYYYPLEFLTVAFNIYQTDKIKSQAITNYAIKQGFNILPPVFGKSKGSFWMDKDTNSIYKGIGSIKDMNNTIGDNLYEYARNETPQDFFDILTNVKELEINKTQLTKLIRIGYFNQFGTINELLIAKEIYNTYGTKKTLKKPCEFDVQGCFGKETAKQYSQLDNLALCRKIFAQHTIPPDSEYALIQNQIEIMGYTMLTIPTAPMNYFALQGVEVNKYGTPFVKLYRLYDGGVIECKMDKKYFEEHPFNKDNSGKFMAGQIMKCAFKSKEKRKKVDGNWVLSGEFEYVLSAYVDVEEE